ncbi:MAG: hypothetical protein GY759_06745 [Chloroflexi bacterium]|nr:hypothetical protein [Chloroflexota bacterium]
MAELERMEAAWNAHPILDYHIVVDVKRPDELRRYDITVQKGEVTDATMLMWNAYEQTWREPYSLDETQSFPFTVTGLFDTVRGALLHSGRTDIRVNMGENPAFPRHIIMGPVWDAGQMVRGTENEIIVREFEP